MLLANLGGSASADIAVVPLLDLRIDYRDIAEAGDLARSAGTYQRTAQDETERPAFEKISDGERLFFPVLCER